MPSYYSMNSKYSTDYSTYNKHYGLRKTKNSILDKKSEIILNIVCIDDTVSLYYRMFFTGPPHKLLEYGTRPPSTQI